MAGARMHHAWMLSGLKGLGKGLFARAAVAELVAELGVPQPPAELHPDILIPEHPPENKEEAKKREDGACEQVAEPDGRDGQERDERNEPFAVIWP